MQGCRRCNSAEAARQHARTEYSLHHSAEHYADASPGKASARAGGRQEVLRWRGCAHLQVPSSTYWIGVDPLISVNCASSGKVQGPPSYEQNKSMTITAACRLTSLPRFGWGGGIGTWIDLQGSGYRLGYCAAREGPISITVVNLRCCKSLGPVHWIKARCGVGDPTFYVGSAASYLCTCM